VFDPILRFHIFEKAFYITYYVFIVLYATQTLLTIHLRFKYFGIKGGILLNKLQAV
jgi:hypothetical protein